MARSLSRIFSAVRASSVPFTHSRMLSVELLDPLFGQGGSRRSVRTGYACTAPYAVTHWYNAGQKSVWARWLSPIGCLQKASMRPDEEEEEEERYTMYVPSSPLPPSPALNGKCNT